MMTTYHIHGKTGADMGTFDAESKAHALAASHRLAGYDVSVKDGALVFRSESDRDQCGDVADWCIEAVDDLDETMDTAYCEWAGIDTAPKLHDDGTVTYWSVYRQWWVRRASSVPADELAAHSAAEREAIRNHLHYTDTALDELR